MVTESILINKFKVISKEKKKKKDIRPRGPKPQSCDHCYIRKAKCDKILPRCTICLRANCPCTYERSGFLEYVQRPIGSKKEFINKRRDTNVEKYENINSIVYKKELNVNFYLKFNSKQAKFIRLALQTSLIKFNKSHIFFNGEGQCSYFGPSLATYYFASTSDLLCDILEPPRFSYQPVLYNKKLDVSFTNIIQAQLIELYFANLNAFFPLLNPSNFYSNLNRRRNDFTFKALLNVVCLSGASYYPNRTFGRIIASHYSKQLSFLLKYIYLKPSITAIQACLLSAYHLSVCADNCSVENGWYYLGLAKTMIGMTGLPIYQPKVDKYMRKLYINLWWMIFCSEAVTSYSFGRPCYIQPEKLPLPSLSPLPSMNYTFPEVFLVKELCNLKPEENTLFFHNFCKLCRFMYQWIKLRDSYEVAISKKELRSINLLRSLCSLSEKDPRPKSVQVLEQESIKWFMHLTKHGSRDINVCIYPLDDKNIHLCYISTLYFSLLIDMNKLFIVKGDIKRLKIKEEVLVDRGLSFQNYISSSCLERCIMSTFFGSQIILDSKKRVVEVAVPFFWYCMLQYFFMLVYIIFEFEDFSRIISRAKSLAKALYKLFKDNSERWIVIRDAYLMIQSMIPNPESLFT